MRTEMMHRTNRNTAGTVYMLLSVIGFSLVPVLIANGNGADNPFLFAAVLRVGVTIALSVLFMALFGRILFRKSVLKLIWLHIPTWSMLFAIINQFEYGLLAFSTRYIDISVAAILFETWPILLILMTALLFRGEGRYRKITLGVILLLLVGFLGFAFVAASETGGLGVWNNAASLDTLIGIVIVVIAVFVAGLSAFAFRWAADLRESLPPDLINNRDSDSLDIACVLVANCITSFAGAGLSAAVGLASGETISTDAIAIAMLGGVFALALGNISWRAANVVTNNLGINALAYAIPIFSLIWLFLFAEVNIAKVGYLIIGTVAIISTNLLINFEAEVRYGFKALVLALWACGAFVYLRDDFLPLLPFDGWLWPRETYLGALGLSATIFTLLLTFRVARLAPRTQDEDNRIFALHGTLELLSRRNLIDSAASEHIRGIDSARTPEELQTAYTQAKLCFARSAAADHPVADQRLLANAETQLNMVVHSRQQGVDFGELFSLIVFGGATVMLALLSRPEVSGWTAFIYEVFSVLFPAVVVFLIVNVWDLHRDRANLVLAAQPGAGGYGVIFRDPRNRRFERGVSTVIGLGITVTYAALLWYKWVA